MCVSLESGAPWWSRDIGTSEAQKVLRSNVTGKKMGTSLPAFGVGKRSIAVPKAPCGGNRAHVEGCPGDGRQNQQKGVGVSRQSRPLLREAPGKEENSTAARAETRSPHPAALQGTHKIRPSDLEKDRIRRSSLSPFSLCP